MDCVDAFPLAAAPMIGWGAVASSLGRGPPRFDGTLRPLKSAAPKAQLRPSISRRELGFGLRVRCGRTPHLTDLGDAGQRVGPKEAVGATPATSHRPLNP